MVCVFLINLLWVMITSMDKQESSMLKPLTFTYLIVLDNVVKNHQQSDDQVDEFRWDRIHSGRIFCFSILIFINYSSPHFQKLMRKGGGRHNYWFSLHQIQTSNTYWWSSDIWHWRSPCSFLNWLTNFSHRPQLFTVSSLVLTSVDVTVSMVMNNY